MNIFENATTRRAVYVNDLHGVGIYYCPNTVSTPSWHTTGSWKASQYIFAVPEELPEGTEFLTHRLDSIDPEYYNRRLSAALYWSRTLRVMPMHFREILEFTNAHANLNS